MLVSSRLNLLSNFLINISAAYFMLAVTTFGFSKNNLAENLIANIGNAILYFALAIRIEDKISYE